MTYKLNVGDIESRIRRCPECNKQFLAYPSNRQRCDLCSPQSDNQRVYRRILSGKYVAISRRDDSRLLVQGYHVANIENGKVVAINAMSEERR